MGRGTIYYDDRSGKLVPDKVWLLGVASLSPLAVEGVLYAKDALDGGGRYHEIEDCPIDKRHVTGTEYLEIALDLFGGDTVGDFVPEMDMGLPIVSARFAEDLRGSALTGYAIEPRVVIGSNQSSVANPKLFCLHVLGRGGLSHRLKVTGRPNLCPHCGKVPMVCPACGAINWPRCVNCEQWTLFLPRAPECSHPNGFHVEGYPPEVEIVEGREWDGSDFFLADKAPFVSSRAKHWMERRHTFPIEFKPALLNIEGVEEKFKQK